MTEKRSTRDAIFFARTQCGHAPHHPRIFNMDTSDLFSHRQTPQAEPLGNTSDERVQNPVFSDLQQNGRQSESRSQ